MVYSREEAARRAELETSNVPGTCQKWTRERFGAPSAGDRDGDGDADAVDGWNSEPESARHYGDRNPPRGVPVAWSGGSKGYGHRAVSLGNGRIRSTDMTSYGYRAGSVGTTTIQQIESSMGVRYLGWSETITAIPIPGAPKPKKTRGEHVGRALWNLGQSSGTGRRGKLIQRAREILFKIKKF